MYLLIFFTDIESYYPIYEIKDFDKNKEALIKRHEENQKKLSEINPFFMETAVTELSFEQLQAGGEMEFEVISGTYKGSRTSSGYGIVHLKK